MKAALVIAVLVLLIAVLVVLLHPGVEEDNHNPLEEFDTASIPEGEEKRDTDPVLMDEETTAYNSRPCLRIRDNTAYENFVSKHVLPEGFNTSDPPWKEYLENNNLCDRPKQSFVDYEKKGFFEKICNGSGSGKRQENNLCTSTSKVQLHVLKVGKNCSFIKNISNRAQYVTVACNKVNRKCRPVHFNSSQDYKPFHTNETCGP